MSVQLMNPLNGEPLEKKGELLVDSSGNEVRLKGGSYRFVNDDNYAGNFGFQWNKFEKTQIDRFQQGSTQSRDRFFSVTGWEEDGLAHQDVLEVGSGAGRFSQVVLQHTKANLYSVDYSNAVEANFRNNGPDDRLHLFQASIYALPFAPGQFDKVFCFGVLQHTPDFRKGVTCLVDMVKPGGELVVDFYPLRGWYTKIQAKYLLRPLSRKMDHQKLLAWIERNADRLIAFYRFFDRIGLGRIVNRFLPVCDIKRTIPRQLDNATLREWVILDTFDMFSPAYDHPQRLQKVIHWFKESGMERVTGSVVRYGEGNQVTIVRGYSKLSK
ncbi:MAG TPA: class I SAM-dependent methyltransferase [Cyclobacteriaceae bacterium]|nr:class I SAM-dependent methyltransferase [Cyclobacteriaceae bacterium]